MLLLLVSLPRLVFVSNEKKVPFAVFSVISFQKQSRMAQHR